MRAIDRSRAIIVRPVPDKELHFRFLTLGDEEFLDALVREDPAPRDFALRLLSHQLLDASPMRLDELDDEALSRAAQSWADQDTSVGQPDRALEPTLGSFKRRVSAHVDVTRQAVQELLLRLQPHVEQHLGAFRRAMAVVSPAMIRSIQEAVLPPEPVLRSIREALTMPVERVEAFSRTFATDAVRSAMLALEERGRLISQFAAAASRQFEQISRAMAAAVPPLGLLGSLPSAQELTAVWQAQMAAIERGELALVDGGFSFAKPLVAPPLAVALAGIPAQVRNAYATRRLLAFTKGVPFAEALEDGVRCSSVARRRWLIVERAYRAHCARDYILSVPVLFSQVEGLFTDSMIVNGLAKLQNGRVYALDTLGSLKLDRNKHPIELTGLGRKTQHSPYQNHAVLSDVVGSLTQALTGQRNGVLHGSDTEYGRAKLSTQLVLLVFVLANEILAFEEGRVTAP